jgi:hypothetical protein
MTWSKVSLHNLDPPGPRPRSSNEYFEFRDFFFHDSATTYDSFFPLLPRFKYPTHTDRLEINYTVDTTVDLATEFLNFLITWSVHREWSRGPRPGDEREDYLPADWVCDPYSPCGWVCMSAACLSLVVDFRQGLRRPEGAAWALYEQGGWLKVTALFRNVVEIEEEYYYGEFEYGYDTVDGFLVPTGSEA